LNIFRLPRVLWRRLPPSTLSPPRAGRRRRTPAAEHRSQPPACRRKAKSHQRPLRRPAIGTTSPRRRHLLCSSGDAVRCRALDRHRRRGGIVMMMLNGGGHHRRCVVRREERRRRCFRPAVAAARRGSGRLWTCPCRRPVSCIPPLCLPSQVCILRTVPYYGTLSVPVVYIFENVL
jgi:hypothetical protein